MKTLHTFISITLIIALNMQNSFADGPKREFRGVWIASVTNLDWPSTPVLSPATERWELTNMLDILRDTGINAVIFQIRPECDALYPSQLEPWSYWLTGEQGRPPQPFYDPLEFAVKEAHKRGMEIHAWFNPYRAEREGGNYTIDENHVINQHPDWILTFGDLKMLDPGLPMVRQHVTNVIMDVVNRYDVDGVHWDDYFYPYPPNHISQTNKDYDTYQNYKHGDQSDETIEDWRRENINILIRMVHDSIQAVKPHVKFGISPFGIYKNNVPEGVYGMDAYRTIFTDPLAWLQEQSIDYLTPQLYWKIGGDQDYNALQKWWSDRVSENNRHFYPGQILKSSYTSNEIPRQIFLNRSNNNTFGQVLFRADLLNTNALNLKTKLQSDYYEYKALLPQMAWKDSVPPNRPQGVYFGPLAYGEPAVIHWNGPGEASDNDYARWYTIYRFPEMPQSGDLNKPEHIVDITGDSSLLAYPPSETLNPSYVTVTTLDDNHNESEMSNVMRIAPPPVPVLTNNGEQMKVLRQVDSLTWNYNSLTSFYHLQVAAEKTFAEVEVDEALLTDTSKVISGLTGLSTYFYRLKAKNPAGESLYSMPDSFRTGFPPTPLLAAPANQSSGIALDTVLTWQQTDSAQSYHVQLAHSQYFQEAYMAIDTLLSGDTMLVVNDLEPFERLWYYWRVRASNDYGQSAWSDVWSFRTVDATAILARSEVPERYYLGQNYPNPFNPKTTIRYAIKRAGHVRLEVYNVLGEKVSTLIDARKQPGLYSVSFDASNYASGVYVYRMRIKDYVAHKKMIIMK